MLNSENSRRLLEVTVNSNHLRGNEFKFNHWQWLQVLVLPSPFLVMVTLISQIFLLRLTSIWAFLFMLLLISNDSASMPHYVKGCNQKFANDAALSQWWDCSSAGHKNALGNLFRSQSTHWAAHLRIGYRIRISDDGPISTIFPVRQVFDLTIIIFNSAFRISMFRAPRSACNRNDSDSPRWSTEKTMAKASSSWRKQ